MEKKKLTNADGYQLVLAWFVRQNGGRRHGAKKMMADALDVSRQTCDNWEDKGIPAKYLQRIKKLTGLTPAEVHPEAFQ